MTLQTALDTYTDKLEFIVGDDSYQVDLVTVNNVHARNMQTGGLTKFSLSVEVSVRTWDEQTNKEINVR